MRNWMWGLLGIFVLAVGVRFWQFKESIYFAYDQARDAYIAQDITLKHDLKLIGPPVSGAKDLFHGPLYWYLLSPLIFISQNDPIAIAAIFRIINAAQVFLVYVVTRKLFNRKIAFMSALLFAVSFEQVQYAYYVGNPTLGGLMILLMFVGVVWQSAPLVFGTAAAAMQFNLMYVYTFLLAGSLAINFKLKNYHWAILLTLVFLSSFIVAEIKYDFRGVRSATNVLSHGYNNMKAGQSRISLYGGKYILMFKDNGFGLIGMVTGTIWLVINIKQKRYKLLAIWVFGWVFLMMLGGHTTYYTNAGLGIGVIILISAILGKLGKLGFLVLVVVLVINFQRIAAQAPRSLISGLAAQEMMKLSDEYRVIDMMYEVAKGKNFTVRQTGIPYKVQTLWAYLFNNYALKKYGYLPSWENGSTAGFPGELPAPKSGTTCLRFRIVEPKRGLPENLIAKDLEEENYFSDAVKQQRFGEFLLETRKAKGNCGN